MSDDGRQEDQKPNVLAELAWVKVLFQLRAIEAVIAAATPRHPHVPIIPQKESRP